MVGLYACHYGKIVKTGNLQSKNGTGVCTAESSEIKFTFSFLPAN
jgi:hypothetical protein